MIKFRFRLFQIHDFFLLFHAYKREGQNLSVGTEILLRGFKEKAESVMAVVERHALCNTIHRASYGADPERFVQEVNKSANLLRRNTDIEL